MADTSSGNGRRLRVITIQGFLPDRLTFGVRHCNNPVHRDIGYLEKAGGDADWAGIGLPDPHRVPVRHTGFDGPKEDGNSLIVPPFSPVILNRWGIGSVADSIHVGQGLLPAVTRPLRAGQVVLQAADVLLQPLNLRLRVAIEPRHNQSLSRSIQL